MNERRDTKRAIINRENGRKGGEATASKYPGGAKEWGHKGGTTTRELYSSDFFSYINSQRRIRSGWPKGKMRKVPVVHTDGLKPESQDALNMMMASIQTSTA